MSWIPTNQGVGCLLYWPAGWPMEGILGARWDTLRRTGEVGNEMSSRESVARSPCPPLHGPKPPGFRTPVICEQGCSACRGASDKHFGGQKSLFAVDGSGSSVAQGGDFCCESRDNGPSESRRTFPRSPRFAAYRSLWREQAPAEHCLDRLQRLGNHGEWPKTHPPTCTESIVPHELACHRQWTWFALATEDADRSLVHPWNQPLEVPRLRWWAGPVARFHFQRTIGGPKTGAAKNIPTGVS